MAMSGPSPPPSYAGPGSPQRSVNGHIESHMPVSMYGPPRMLPPSPQHYPPRHLNGPVPTPSPSIPMFNESRAPPPPPPQKRPGSSMSISSMLGGEPERSQRDFYSNQPVRAPARPSSASTPSMMLGAVMSPPQQPMRPGEYNYKPRSQTPDRIRPLFETGRQRSSSSGMTQRPGYGYDAPDQGLMRMRESYPLPFGGATESDSQEKARRTSLSGILQRPSSQPQPSVPSMQQLFNADALRNEHIFSDHPGQNKSQNSEGQQRSNGVSNAYDTRPPGFGAPPRPMSSAQDLSPPSMSLSPELRRPQLNGGSSRAFANLLNGPTSQTTDMERMGSQNMSRQDSTQSHTERSILGERNRFRPYSPFAAPQPGTTSTNDEPARKGSDEIAHRAIVGLGLDSKRSKYSPVPQAVQGAQAHTPVPDGGIKSEHGRVFSGIGSGIGSSSTGPSTAPVRLSASPFKRDEGVMRLSEDNLLKMSRTTSGFGKRVRKAQEDDGRAGSETLDVKKPARPVKRGKHQHQVKMDGEDITPGISRRMTPISGLNPSRREGTPVTSGTNGNQQRHMETTPIFKPRKMVKVATVMGSAMRRPRRHLGTFTYNPIVSVPDTSNSGGSHFDVSITPIPPPSFTSPDDVNCTYTVLVAGTWLQDLERKLISSTRNLWGTGIYTDDSDPIAAAMHAGFLHTSYPQGIDMNLLERVIEDQNPKVDFLKEFKPPMKPMEVQNDKDLKITLVVMPQLESYDESVRFGIKSRSWPGQGSQTCHDGVSFAILKIEFISIGIEERRMGRTGKEKRERRMQDMYARKNAAEIEKQRIDRYRKKELGERKRKMIESKSNNGLTVVAVPTSVPADLHVDKMLFESSGNLTQDVSSTATTITTLA